MTDIELTAAATAYRAVCDGADEKLVVFGHLDCVVDWAAQKVRVTGESRTTEVDMSDPAFTARVRHLGRL